VPPRPGNQNAHEHAAYIHGAYDVRVEAVEPVTAEGAARAGKVLLDVACVGICGSDLHYYKDGGIGSDHIAAPFIPGHEVAARAIQAIPDLGIEAGDLVGIDPAVPCHACEHCMRGHRNLCTQLQFLGAPPRHGALQRRIAVDPRCIKRVPTSWSPAKVAMLEPLGIAVHAMDLARPGIGQSVAVLGCGPIGLLLIQLLRAAGVRDIYAVDPLQYRVDAAVSAGARHGALKGSAVSTLTVAGTAT